MTLDDKTLEIARQSAIGRVLQNVLTSDAAVDELFSKLLVDLEPVITKRCTNAYNEGFCDGYEQANEQW